MIHEPAPGPIGFFSDAHGNTEAFLVAYNSLKAAGAKDVWYLGDLVGYVPDPVIVSKAQALPINCLSGNHEAMLLSSTEPGPREGAYRHHEIRCSLSGSDLAFLEGLNPSARLDVNGKRLLVVHGSPTDPINGYIYPDTDLSTFKDTEADLVFAGHTHRPMDRSIEGIRFINVGSCGLPRDGRGVASACLYDPEANQVKFLDLEISETCRDLMERYNLSSVVTKHYQAIIDHKTSKEIN